MNMYLATVTFQCAIILIIAEHQSYHNFSDNGVASNSLNILNLKSRSVTSISSFKNISTPKNIASSHKISSPKNGTSSKKARKKVTSSKNVSTPKNISTSKMVSSSKKVSSPKKISSSNVTSSKSATKEVSSSKKVNSPKDISSPKNISSSKNISPPKDISSPKNISSPNLTSSKKASKKVSSPKNISSSNVTSSKNASKEVSSSKKVNSPKNISPPKDFSSLKNISSPDGINSSKNISSSKNIIPPKDISSSKNIIPPKDISSPEDISSSKNISSADDINSFKNISSSKNISYPEDISSPKNISLKNSDKDEDEEDKKKKTTTEKTFITDIATCADLNSTAKTRFIVLIIVSYSGRLVCMGSILDESHILTARTCFAEVNVASLMIIANYLSPFFGRTSQVRFIKKVITHEQQLSIIVLERPLIFGLGIGPIQMAKFTPFEDWPKDHIEEYFVVGFKISKSVTQGESLQKMEIYNVKKEPLLQEADCEEHIQNDELYSRLFDKNFMFCSTGKSEFCWTCTGSPTLIRINGKFVQIGIVWGASCESNPEKSDEENLPKISVHVRVDKFLKWIKANSFSVR